MKKIFTAFAAIFLIGSAILLNGCCHAQVFTHPANDNLKKQVIDNMQPVAVGQAVNSGYYLFNLWPLYTGNPEQYNRKDYHSFHDDINSNVTSSILLEEMHRRYGADKLADVKHSESSWGWFSLWIVWRRVVTTDAIGLKKIKVNRN